MTPAPGTNSPPYVDLHSHSTASDGALPPAAVALEAARLGLSAIALTDHDTVAGLAEAQATGREAGVRVVAGVELSAVEGNSETHVLGLHLLDTTRLDAQLADLRAMRRRRAESIVRRLNELGVPVEFAAVLQHAAGGAIGRPHVARALVDGGWATDFRDAFGRYLGNGKAAFVAKESLPLADAIAMIHGAGGLSVLAHPGAAGTRERLESLAALGLDGVEVLHPSHSSEDITRLGALADHFGLVRSGGSDWHGGADGPRALGAMHIPAEWLQKQDERLAARRARVA